MLIEGGTRKSHHPKPDTVSVIIVTYNAAQTLQHCLESIYAQKYPAIEIVVIDGQSTDGTPDILRQNNNRIDYWRSEKDAGIYYAMNKALQYATGQWIYFLGADDALFDGFSGMAYELKDRQAIYYGRVLTAGGPTFPVSAYAFAKIGICHQAMIYPREVFDTYRFDMKYRISADYALNIILYNSKTYHFTFKDYLIARFNDTGVSSTQVDQAFEKDRSGIVLKYFGLKIWLRFLFWRYKKKREQLNNGEV